MALEDVLTEELEFLKSIIKFKKSLSKSSYGEFLVDLNIYKEEEKWYFELRDAVNTSNDEDLFFHDIYKLDDEIIVYNLYNKIIDFHLRYAKQSNVIIWCWNEISVPPEISDKEFEIKLSLNPLQRELLELALYKIKNNTNHMSLNFHDSSSVNYHLNDDFVVKQYKDLLYKYESSLFGDIEIIDYTEIYNDNEREK